MTRIDAHLHVWRAASGETPSVRTVIPPQTDVPIELASETMVDNQIDRAVLVQPVFRGEDNSYVAACARAEPERFAAVAVVDPRAPGAEERLEQWVAAGCRGLRLRPRIAAEESIFGDPATFPLWKTAERLGVVVSLLSGPDHVSTIDRLAQRFPQVAVVVDHLGHPSISAGIADSKFQGLLGLARHEHVYLKLSGLYHFSGERFPFRDCVPMVRAIYERFGPRRLLWGSDFPHVLLACGYARSLRLLEVMFDNLTVSESDQVLGANALRLYWSGD